MHVEIDLSRCEANALCIALAPELFELDDSGNFARVRDDSPGETALADAQRAAVSCPRQAITVNPN